MRRTLIASSLAALSLGVLAGGAAFAAESDGSPATPTTLPPGMEILGSLGLSPEQIDCVVSNAESIDMSDVVALTEVLTQCGVGVVSVDDAGPGSTVAVEEVVDTAGEAPPPTDIDAETASALLVLLGLDTTAVDCVVSEAATAAPTDDASALAVLNTCGVGPLQVVEAIVALDTLAAAGGPVDTTTDVVVSAPPVTSGNAMVDMLITQFEASGITLDAEQAQCLLDNISQLDPGDLMASLDVFTETCGIDITQLIPDN